MLFVSSTKRGFTLIEVLVALVVLAAIGVTLVQTSETGTESSRYLKHKLFASWVAEDRATMLRVAARLGQVAVFDDLIVDQGGGRFLTSVSLVKQTDLLNRIEIQVFYLENGQTIKPASPIYQLSSYLPQTPLSGSSEGNENAL